MSYTYILKLEFNKYYIGKTNNPKFTLEDHINIEWTKIYKPIKLVKIIKNNDNFDDDQLILRYMKKKGIKNVRGGSFNGSRILPIERKSIERMISLFMG
jgi:predicted GIY-YIG superfamily endonuclease